MQLIGTPGSSADFCKPKINLPFTPLGIITRLADRRLCPICGTQISAFGNFPRILCYDTDCLLENKLKGLDTGRVLE